LYPGFIEMRQMQIGATDQVIHMNQMVEKRGEGEFLFFLARSWSDFV